jgi:hypothetical protein
VLLDEAGEVVDDLEVRLEAGLGGLGLVRLEVIDTADAVEDVELQARVVAEKLADRDEVVGRDDDERVDRIRLLVPDPRPELLIQDGDDFGGGHSSSASSGGSPALSVPRIFAGSASSCSKYDSMSLRATS